MTGQIAALVFASEQDREPVPVLVALGLDDARVVEGVVERAVLAAALESRLGRVVALWWHGPGAWPRAYIRDALGWTITDRRLFDVPREWPGRPGVGHADCGMPGCGTTARCWRCLPDERS